MEDSRLRSARLTGRYAMTLDQALLDRRSLVPPEAPVKEQEPSQGGRDGHRRIRCPRCGWEPKPQDRWSCLCGHAWNTFDTRGVCPRCRYVWDDTCCLSCHRWSRHDDWYERAPPA